MSLLDTATPRSEDGIKMSESLQDIHSTHYYIYPPLTEDYDGFWNNLIRKSYKGQIKDKRRIVMVYRGR